MDLSDNLSERDSISDDSLNTSLLCHPICTGHELKDPKLTWRKLTEDDRQVHTSLTKLRDRDLSVHLFNAHAMKRRHYDLNVATKLKPWSNKDRWRGDVHEEDSNIASFVPPKTWTAWPMNPDTVPRNEEQVGSRDKTDIWTVKGTEVLNPSYELEDVLMGITLKIAKEKFEKRELNPLSTSTDCLKEIHVEADDDLDGIANENTSDVSERPGMENLADLPSDFANSMVENSDVASFGVDQVIGGTKEPSDYSSDANSDVELVSGHTYGLEHAIISADDDRSNLLLQPSIRHNLTQLDAILRALHHTRQTCLRYASDRIEPQKDVESGSESIEERYKSNQSPLTPLASVYLPIIPPENEKFGLSQRSLSSTLTSKELALSKPVDMPKKKKRGGKRHIHVPLEEDTQEEMQIRIARSPKKAIPFTFLEPSTEDPFSSIKVSQGGSKKRGMSLRTQDKRSTRLGLRDWSEIIGAATLVGISSEVILRSTQRCTNLFGEGMTLRFLVDLPILGNLGDKSLHYLPRQTPFPDSSSESDLLVIKGDESHTQKEKRPTTGSYDCQQSSSNRTNPTYSDDSKIVSDTRAVSVSHRCFYEWCVRSERAFDRKDHLRRHMESVHKISKDKLKEFLEDSTEEMDEGLHVDGFLKEIRRRKGWRGADSNLRKGSKKGRVTESGALSFIGKS